MYITGQQVIVNWKIMSKPVVPVISDFDVLVQRPDGTKANHLGTLYRNTALSSATADDYMLSFAFTPDVSGVWVVKLTNGTSSAHLVYKSTGLTIHDPDTEVYQQVTVRMLDNALAALLAGTELG